MTTDLDTNFTFDESLEPDILTDKEENKLLPCRKCRRPCVVNRFASPLKTECSFCRKQPGTKAVVFEFDDSLETQVLTDKDETKEVPCVQCKRRCVVTAFATTSKVKCNTCRGEIKREHKQQVQIAQAHTVDPAKLENLHDALINPPLGQVPHCPFDPEHFVELKSVVHSANYGPRRFAGWVKGLPRWDQETGESCTYQCNDCLTVISFSTMHPIMLRAQNEVRRTEALETRALESILGTRPQAA